MTYTFQPRGVCSRAMSVEVDDQGVIRDLQVVGGCNGNLQGISALVKGMKAEEAITRLKGINCGGREAPPAPTSLPADWKRPWRRSKHPFVTA